MTGIYVSADARAAVLASYDTRLSMLARIHSLDARTIETTHGDTHVLIMGPADAPPLVVVHGANGDALQMATPLGSLAETHRCVFVDVPGEPNRSCETPLPLTGLAVGRWMAELLDALAIPKTSLWGMSGGGYVALRAASTIPERVDRAVLVVPAGFVPMGAIPEATAANARALVAALTGPSSGLPPAAIEQSVTHMRLVLGAIRDPFHLAGPLFTPGELTAFDAPVLVGAGGSDAIFPGAALLERARMVLPALEETVLLPEANHIHLDWVFDGPFLDVARPFLGG